jgi:hypothetical protein
MNGVDVDVCLLIIIVASHATFFSSRFYAFFLKNA